MKNGTDFEQHAQQVAKVSEHAKEIQRTRVGGLGGSDAAILLRIGKNGMSALTASDTKRIAVMLGMVQQKDWAGNDYTTAGHAFEDFVAETQPLGKDVIFERETYLSKELAKHFKTFAHADFTVKTKGVKGFNVVECKYVQDTIKKVAQKYAAQLQWYYLLGASKVILCHGQGDIPFDANTVEADILNIQRDEEICKFILAGIKTLDAAIGSGWKPITPECCELSDASATVQKAFETLRKIKTLRKQMDDDEAQAKAVILEYLTDFAFSSVTDGTSSAMLKKESITRTFDKTKLFKEHPEFDKEDYYKATTRKAYVTFE